MRLHVYRTYSDAGALAVDERDGHVAVFVLAGLPVNTSTVTGPGTTHRIVYAARDAAGNTASLTRHVEVVDECVLPEFTCPPAKWVHGMSSWSLQRMP